MTSDPFVIVQKKSDEYRKFKIDAIRTKNTGLMQQFKDVSKSKKESVIIANGFFDLLMLTSANMPEGCDLVIVDEDLLKFLKEIIDQNKAVNEGLSSNHTETFIGK